MSVLDKPVCPKCKTNSNNNHCKSKTCCWKVCVRCPQNGRAPLVFTRDKFFGTKEGL